MVKDNKNKKNESFGEVEVALTKTEQFLEKHLNLVLYVIAGIVVVVLGFLSIKRYYVSPRNTEALEQMFQAQNYFETDSFSLAVNGDGISLGFLDIIDEYGSTKAGNLAKYYTGISYLHMGEYDLALDYLKKFKTDDMLLEPLAQSGIGDAYSELEEYNKAIAAYQKAIKINSNELTTPAIQVKLALVYEATGEKDKALELFKAIKDDYPGYSDAVLVEKNIARLSQ
ncbi:MAG TPA: tetratricopeptide repeat protein [Prolixibacteraceae bacterium]|nr:tetratricopeptide repeat protein [Prolixibacteraceae bacterium]